jgi:hypothetical protein
MIRGACATNRNDTIGIFEKYISCHKDKIPIFLRSHLFGICVCHLKNKSLWMPTNKKRGWLFIKSEPYHSCWFLHSKFTFTTKSNKGNINNFPHLNSI